MAVFPSVSSEEDIWGTYLGADIPQFARDSVLCDLTSTRAI